jgi:hypothetical protein
MIDDTTVLRLSPQATFRPLGEGEGAVVLRFDSGQLFSCNDTTVAFLEAIDGKTPFAAAIDAVHAKFEVDRTVLRADLQELAGHLVDEGLVEIAA